MGTVYRARDPVIGRVVVIKTISGDFVKNPEMLGRFFQEATAAGKLQHPNIVTIYDVGEADGRPYIVMEFLEGNALDRIITRVMNLRLVHKVRYILEICRGLQYAHHRGVIHRDIKPSNIFVTLEDRVKILDFGIARLTDFSEARQKTVTGVIVGTMAYLSPEQIQGKSANEATDIWAVGVTAYELLSYKKPFNGESFANLLQSILSVEPTPLNELIPNLPIDLQNLIAKMLRKEVNDRFRTMDDLLPELERIYKSISELSVREILDSTAVLLQSADTLKAVGALREVLQIDSTNAEAIHLLRKAQSALKDKSVTTRLQSLVESATSSLRQGKVLEARESAESAIQIDPGYEPALQVLQETNRLDHQTETINQLLKQAEEKLAIRDFTSLEEVARQILALQAENKEAQFFSQKARAQSQTAGPGVTALSVLPPPTGFFGEGAVSRTRFFEGDQVRYQKIQESLKFYRDHLNGEYQSLSNQAKFTYYLWIASVVLGLAALVSGVILLLLKQFAAGSVSAISTTFVYFIQKVFQQREDHYRSLAAAKHDHLEYGNHWLLVIQSIDSIGNPDEKARRQSELVDVLTRKLAATPGGQVQHRRTPSPKRAKRNQ